MGRSRERHATRTRWLGAGRRAVLVVAAVLGVGLPTARVGAAGAAGTAPAGPRAGGPAGAVATGLLRVTVDPPVPSQILVDDVPADSWGLTWVKVPAGPHTVCFRDVAGFTTPPCRSVTVTAGATTTTVGSFTRRGTLRVTTSPAVASTVTVDGTPRNDWGMWTDLDAGSHQVCFGPVAGFDPPACRTVDLTAGTTTTVTGTFTPNPAAPGPTGSGTLRVTTSPAVPVQVVVDGTIRDSWGAWFAIAPGPHTVCFTSIEGYTTPGCQTVTVATGATTNVTGTFTARGSLRVITNPAVAATIDVDGLPRNDWGMWTDLPTGDHTVCFGAVPVLVTPACQQVTLSAGATTSVTVTYPTVPLRFTELATLSAPSDLSARTGSSLLYVAERYGTIRSVDPATGTVSAPLLDLSADLATDGERGVLGLTFSPDGTRLYVSFNPADGNSAIDEFTMNGDSVVTGSRRAVIRVTQPPESNHKGGHLAFGPDGMLWWGLGDGGGQGDPYANGQRLDTLLAGMVRIDPTGRANGGYSVPADNPWAAGGGAPEKWLRGLRNPWRFSFDRATGDLWIADVGQDAWEEVDLLAAPDRGRGANLGWSLREGTHQYSGPAPAGALDPVFEYPHGVNDANGCAITGGFVYRGSAIPELVGTYLYTDFCISTLHGIRVSGGGVDSFDFGAQITGGGIVSFGEGPDGELYALSINSGVIGRVDRG